MSAMEINHTRIYGVSHCPPLSEQSVTSKPNAYFGYIPQSTPAATPADPVETLLLSQTKQNIPSNQHGNSFPYPERNHEPAVELKASDQYTIENDQPSLKTQERLGNHVDLSLQDTNNDLQSSSSGKQVKTDEIPVHNTQTRTTTIIDNSSAQDQVQNNSNYSQVFDPVQQGQQITKLTSEIEELRNRIKKLSSQNEMLLNQQFNKSTVNEQSSNLTTTKPPNENLTDTQKP